MRKTAMKTKDAGDGRPGVFFRDDTGKEYFWIQEGDSVCLRYGRQGTSVLLGYRYIDHDYAKLGGVTEHIETWMTRNKSAQYDVVKKNSKID
jgi:hypothetical protein